MVTHDGVIFSSSVAHYITINDSSVDVGQPEQTTRIVTINKYDM